MFSTVKVGKDCFVSVHCCKAPQRDLLAFSLSPHMRAKLSSYCWETPCHPSFISISDSMCFFPWHIHSFIYSFTKYLIEHFGCALALGARHGAEDQSPHCCLECFLLLPHVSHSVFTSHEDLVTHCTSSPTPTCVQISTGFTSSPMHSLFTSGTL